MPPFIPLPRFMLAGEYSINAKLLYGLLLNRTTLSQKSGRVSEDGNVYVIYTIKQMADDLDRSERTVKTALRELENAGLITRVRQGWNQANRIFLQIPDRVQLSSRQEGNICPMDVQDSSPCMGQKSPASNTDTEYKEHRKTERVESTRRRYGEFQNVFLSGQARNVPGWKRLIPAKLPNTLSGRPGIWLPMTSTMPIITPPSRSGWMRTARAGARKTTPTTITRERVYESDFYENG